MAAAYALAVSILFGAGVYAMLKRDLIRVVLGVTLVSYGVNLFLIAAAFSRGAAPIHPIPPDTPVSDPLVQALVLTAIVIGAGTIAVLIGVVHRAFVVYGTVDQAVVAGRRAPGSRVEDRGGER